MSDPDHSHFWKRKLAAYLHDPPSKCVDIRLHEEHARRLYRQAGFVVEEENRHLSDAYAKPSDFAASAADRFPFPKSRGNLSSVFDGVLAMFHHPLSFQTFPFHKTFQSAEMALEVDETLQPIATDVDGWSEKEQWKARLFCHWRLWEKFCTEKDYRFAFLPAETRLPDHTVWTHMQVVSALDGCADGVGKNAVLKPAFLKFQLGPVQEFIAEARSVRDLWSGSYLLSWLMAAGMKALAMKAGPDSVIFPNLKGQPVFDLHLREQLWSQVKVNKMTVWDHLAYTDKDLLTPNLPNVFLAVVHRDRAKELGEKVEKAIRDEWENIAQSVWQFCEEEEMIPKEEAGFTSAQRKERFFRQADRFLSLSWQTTPWPETLDEALKLRGSFDKDSSGAVIKDKNSKMPIQKASEQVEAIVEYATKTMPEADRDGRYYIGGDQGTKAQLNNIGLGWSVILALNGWQLDAVRQSRSFKAWSEGGWNVGVFGNKDSLGGKAEAVAGGKEWCSSAKKKGGAWKALFKSEDWLGASTLIKRLWHLSYLQKKPWNLKTDPKNFPMPNTHGIAKGEPESSDENEDIELLSGEKYFAVLALDGDEIGKWVSGEKTPKFQSQFSDYKDENGTGSQRQGALRYFEDNNGQNLLETSRALSPSFHLQFSNALSNFALNCARNIVEKHRGRLIYAGGDDVLAMLPADTALECAQALRNAFQGRAPGSAENANHPQGFLSMGKDYSKQPIYFIVPGPAADCSVGIAIAHFKSPLQDVVRAAQAAEKRAKNQLGRAAIAVSLFKRSGEITEWGCKWESGGLALYGRIAQALDSGSLSAKFPHRVCQLLEPYLTKRSGFGKQGETFDEKSTREIIEKEFAFTVSQQSSSQYLKQDKEGLRECLNGYLKQIIAEFHKNNERLIEENSPPIPKDILPQILLTELIGLCTAVAFAHRTKSAPKPTESSIQSSTH